MPETEYDRAAMSRRQAIARGLRVLGAGSLGAAIAGCANGRTGFTLLSAEERARLREPISIRPYRPQFDPSAPRWTPGGGLTNAIGRASWAGGSPVPALMDRMKPINKITIHHDGMTPFTNTSRSAGAHRVEDIRRAHRGQNWGDVGYHYLIDPAGRVWQGRPIEWQGAHVGGQNNGNIGICVMGNFERQHPNDRQLSTVEDSVAQLMRQFNISLREVRTHREMAATVCPGRSLQPRLVAMRSGRGALARVS